MFPPCGIGSDIRPLILDPDSLAVEYILASKDAHAIAEFPYYRRRQVAIVRVESAGLIVQLINTPLTGHRVEYAERHADVAWTPCVGNKVVKVANATRQFARLPHCLKGFPFGRPGKPLHRLFRSAQSAEDRLQL